MFIETTIYAGKDIIGDGSPIYHTVLINTDMICYINYDVHRIHFAAPYGSGMTTGNLSVQIARKEWDKFMEAFAASQNAN